MGGSFPVYPDCHSTAISKRRGKKTDQRWRRKGITARANVSGPLPLGKKRKRTECRSGKTKKRGKKLRNGESSRESAKRRNTRRTTDAFYEKERVPSNDPNLKTVDETKRASHGCLSVQGKKKSPGNGK